MVLPIIILLTIIRIIFKSNWANTLKKIIKFKKVMYSILKKKKKIIKKINV